MEELLDARGATVAETTPGFGISPLAHACEHGFVSAVRLLLRFGVSPDQPAAPDWPTVTPLLVALANASNGCMRALLAAGANPNQRCEASWFFNPLATPCTPLFLADLTRNRPARAMLIEHGAVGAALHRENAVGQKVHSFLRATYVDPVARVERAICRGASARVVQRYLRDVADLDAQAGCLVGATVQAGRPDCLETLLSEGGDPNLAAAELLAEHDGDGAQTRLLLRYGYDPTAGGSNKPLLYACAAGNTGMVAALLGAGIDPNLAPYEKIDADNAYGLPAELHAERCTALMIACGHGHLRLAELLLRHGADSGDRDSQGRTAHDYARFSREETHPLINSLLEHERRHTRQHSTPF